MSLFHSLLEDVGTPPAIPPSENVMLINPTGYGYMDVAARQLALEPIVSSGIDKAISYSVWINPSMLVASDNGNRVFGVANNAGSVPQSGLTVNAQTWLLNYTLYQSFAGTYIRITTSKSIPKNRWSHVVLTYSGSETNAGFEIYINGALDSSAVKNTVGSYTGGASFSTHRFGVSSSFSSTGRYGGHMSDLCVWNRVLTSGEVTTLYNSGSIYDVSAASFYASAITAYWPMRSNADCLNNATYNFTGVTDVTYVSKPFGPFYTPLAAVNAIPTNTEYTGGGSFIRIGNDMHFYSRAALNHTSNGRIIKLVWHEDGFYADAPIDVLSDPTYNLTGSISGNVGGQIMIFTARYNSPTYISSDRYESTDGTVGEAFGSMINMPGTYSDYNFTGKVINGYVGERMVGFFEHNAPETIWRLNFWKRDTAGTWTIHEIFTDGTLKLAEHATLVAGNNTFITIARGNGTDTGLWMLYSTDGGTTWSTPANTGLIASGTIGMGDMCLDPHGNVVLIFANRGDRTIKISKGNSIANVLANTWNTPVTIFQGFSTDPRGIYGYPTIVRKGWNYTVAWTAEKSNTEAHLFIGQGRLDID